MNEVWERVPGQQRVVELLSAAARRPKDAYLLTGPPGVGKSAAARIFAAAILCPDSCGACNICRRVIEGIHPDVQVFQPEGFTFSVDLIREAVAAASHTPLEGAQRVFILDEADRIVENSQNALLKALEEPGASVTWILVAETLHPFLPTILSRCTVVEFTPVPEEATAQLLSERFGLTDEMAERVVRATRGDLEESFALAQDDGTVRIRALALEAATGIDRNPAWAFETAGRLGELVAQAKEALSERHTAELEAFRKSRGLAREEKRIEDRHKREVRRAETHAYNQFLRWLASAFRDLAAASSGAGSESLTNQDEAERISQAAARNSRNWLELVDICLVAMQSIRQNAIASLQVEAILLRLTGEPLLQS